MINLYQDSQDKLHREINQYQHELSTLQSTYSQKIANLNKKHKLEMQKWDDEKQGYLRSIEDLQHELKILEGNIRYRHFISLLVLRYLILMERKSQERVKELK